MIPTYVTQLHPDPQSPGEQHLQVAGVDAAAAVVVLRPQVHKFLQATWVQAPLLLRYSNSDD